MLNGESVDALSTIVHVSHKETVAKSMASLLKNVIQRQLFEIAIQVAVGTRVIARESVKPFRKNVTAKCVRMI